MENCAFKKASYICLYLLLLLSGGATPPITAESKPAAKEAGAPVVFDGKPIFHVRERMLSFSAEERARAISTKLIRIAKDPSLSSEDIRVVSGEGTMDIVLGEQILMSVTLKDAKSSGVTIEALANQNLRAIKQAIRDYRQTHSFKNLLWSIGYTFVATLVLAFLLLLLRRLFPALYRRINSLQGRHIQNVRIQQIELLKAEQIISVLTGLARLARAIITLVLLYFYVPLVFSFFPQTKNWAAKLLDYIFDPLQSIGVSILNYLPNLFLIAIATVLVRFVLKFVRMIFNEIKRGRIVLSGFYPEWADTTYKITRFLILALTVVMLFPYIPGSHSSAFKGVSVFLGVLLSLGSTSAVANMMAGVLLTYMRPFKTGDRVKVGDTVGDVLEKNLLATRLRTIKNVEVTLPNSTVLNCSIINYSAMAKDQGTILNAKVSIGYDAPWRQVHDLLIAAAQETGDLMQTPKPFVLQTSLDDFYVSYEINAYTDAPHKMAQIYSHLHQNIQDKFNEAKIQIMSPHFMTQPEKAVIAAARSRNATGEEQKDAQSRL